jgi:hypothetical protein
VQLRHRIFGTSDGVTDGALVVVDLVVVAALKGLVAEEVNCGVGHAAGLLGLVLQVLQAICLVPAGWEDIEGDLATNGEATGESMLVSVSIFAVPQPLHLVCLVPGYVIGKDSG